MDTAPQFTNGAPYQMGTPSTQTAGGTTSSSSAAGPSNAYYWLQLALQGASAYGNYSSAQRANRQNVSLQRDQLDWEERMANTAVQRRAADIEAAGGNRALAFTTGAEASTPTIAPAHVDAAPVGSINLMSARLMKEQLDNMQADTRVKNATAQKTQVEADIASGASQSELDLRNARNIKEREWLDIKTDILANTDIKTSAEARQAEGQVDAMIRIIKNNAEVSDMNKQKLKELFDASGIDTNSNWFEKAWSLLLYNFLNRVGK